MGLIRVEKINHGIACRLGNTIFINNRLTEQPDLYAAIIAHERKHSSGFTWNDVVLDLDNKELKKLKREYYLFIITHPSSWTEFFPFWFYEGKFVLNPMITFIYFVSLIFSRFIWIRLT